MVDVLKSIGLTEQKAQETLRNEALSRSLIEIIQQANNICGGSPTSDQGKLLYHVATRVKNQYRQHVPMVVEHICKSRIKNEAQLSAALDFLLHHATVAFRPEEFEKACGIGSETTAADVEEAVASAIKRCESDLLAQRYRFNASQLMGEIRKTLPFADGSLIKNELDLQIRLLLGPKTVGEITAVGGGGKTSKEKGKKSANGTAVSSKGFKAKETPSPAAQVIKEDAITASSTSFSAGECSLEELMKKVKFHKPGENYKTEGYVVTPKTFELLQGHLKQTGGKIVTRFPPEPNGILHIGHAKAISIDFGYAKAHNGICYLRYDDTNPEKEEERFFTSILEMVEWLGYKPYKITHSSDYFDQLYEFAVELIKRGHAYVCHQSADEMKGFNPTPSPWRDRPIKESLALFEDMKNGKFNEGDATLRMKVTLEEGKVDPVAYRIKYVAHARTGNKWCIYPTYDYTHCLCDSLENISHSLCTKEFQSRRSSYYWLCNVLDVYCPVQWEYGRLNMNHTVVSKRKILKLIQANIINDWDDPRLFTLPALRRRGFPPEAIKTFVAKMGVTTAQVFAEPEMLEACVRDVLSRTAPRYMAILRPLRVKIITGAETLPHTLKVPDFPGDVCSAFHSIFFDPVFYIDQEDFMETADSSFKRFTIKQAVGLKHVGLVLTCNNVVKDSSGVVSELHVSAEPLTSENKPKGFIHWVAKPMTCEIRTYERLFLHKNPEDTSEVPGGFLSDVNKDSLKVYSTAMVDQSMKSFKVYDRFQFERVGYFVVDQDSTAEKIVFNRTVSLKDSFLKQSSSRPILCASEQV